MTPPQNTPRTENPTRVVVMTGATSGIGAAAAADLAARDDTLVLAGARGTNRNVPPGVETLPLDLTSLHDVREFAGAVTRRLDGRRIDALVLNAGMQVRRTGSLTLDGFETTFAVNHLAHYLLARLLTPHLADGARLVLTTSDTHDPALVPLAPRSIDIESLAHPNRPGSGFRAYAASKLCNLQTARGLFGQPEIRQRGVTVIAYNPGLTADTNLFTHGPRARRLMSTVGVHVLSLIGRVKPAFVMGSRDRAGEVLAQLASGDIAPPPGQVYVSLVKGEVTTPAPAALARDDSVRDDLWRRSADWVRLDTTRP